MRPPVLRLSLDELVVDSFAGGGGASTGIEMALGRSPDIAINHDAAAIEMHRRNHPHTRHYQEDVWRVDPVQACGGRPVGLAWFSPDCTHFSRAKGSQPVKKSVRGLAWVVIRWAQSVRPRVIVLENVEEFQTWGPVVDSRPDPARAGKTFRAWSSKLRSLGYDVEFRTLVAADYGTPTIRRRLFMVARCDGAAIEWPSPTHGRGTGRAWIPASDIIDWSLPAQSVYHRARPLAAATMARVEEGIRRHVVGALRPMLRPAPGGFDAPFVTKHYGGVIGHPLDRPIGTVTGQDHHALTTAFLVKYYGTGTTQALDCPLHTVTGKARFGLVQVYGEPYQIADATMRMLDPRELFAAQGFPAGYIMTGTKTQQISLAGNSVCPQVAAAIVAANVGTREQRRTA